MKTSHEIDKRQQGVVPEAPHSDTSSEPFLKWNYEFNEKTGKNEFKSLELSDKSKMNMDNLKGALRRAVGTNDVAIGERILNNAAYGMTAERNDERLNQASALLPALRPKDETEAMLLGQFLALQDSGMKCLRRANLPEQGFYHVEKLFHLANKLMNTANQTMQTVLKYRSGGQQTVQVVHVHNEGQAIVTQNLSSQPRGEGSKEKFEN
ncbi:MAG: hypothetical protein WA347_03050 [Rhabdochlamydiaceae bacterium]|jgi:hypothetical protein